MQVKRFFQIRNPISEKHRSEKGQIAVILILVAAVGLIFYAVVFNFNRISQIKTLTMQAANASAAQMVSSMASYGESVWQVYLKGKLDGKKPGYCKHDNVFKMIIKFIIILIIVIIAVITGQWWAIYAIIALAYSFVAIVLQVTVVQPGLTDAWNKMIANLSIADQFVEMGVQAGIQGVVTDNVQIPDLIDSDSDGIFGDLQNPSDKKSAPDYISRFGYNYTQRLRRIPIVDSSAVNYFINGIKDVGGLKDLLVKTGDVNDWGVHAAGTGSALSACCLPDAAENPDRPACCDLPIDNDDFCGDKDKDNYDEECSLGVRPEGCPSNSKAICAKESIYSTVTNQNPQGLYNGRYDYPYAYEAFPENTNNAALSFRAQLGRDDEHHLYRRDPNNPNGRQLLISPIPPEGTPGRFFVEDASGVFPFFYKIGQWGVDLNEIDYSKVTTEDVRCNLCDAGKMLGAPLNSSTNPGVCTNLPSEVSPQLSLPLNPTQDGGFRPSGGWCVDSVNTGKAGDPPQVLDIVPSINELFTPTNPNPDSIPPEEECAVGPGNAGGWKPGADRFCSTVYPYSSACFKHGGKDQCLVDSEMGPIGFDCLCGEGAAASVSANLWPDDALDEIVYGLPYFIEYAQGLVNVSTIQLNQTLVEWYEQTADWIEPGCERTENPSCPPGCEANSSCPPGCEKKTSCPGSFTKKGRDGPLKTVSGKMVAGSVLDKNEKGENEKIVGGGGYLYGWVRDLANFRNPIYHWLYPTQEKAYVADSCTIKSAADDKAAWCVPPSQNSKNNFDVKECPGVTAEEAETFDANKNGVRGDVEDVVACLRFNAGDAAKGKLSNEAKFTACQTACSTGTDVTTQCAYLPRSVVPGFINSYENYFDGQQVKGNPCADTNFKTLLDKSVEESRNQDVKLQKRLKFLDGRLKEAQNIAGETGVFTAAINKLEAFLNAGTKFAAPTVKPVQDLGNGLVASIVEQIADPVVVLNNQDSPSEALIQEMLKPEVAPDQKGLSSVVVYVWQDAQRDDLRTTASGRKTFEGYWHAVKAEVRMPTRCNYACGVNGGWDPEYPSIKTKTKGFLGSTRCYYLENSDGMVKARTIRFDEDVDPKKMAFPNGTPIWDFRFFHPDAGKASIQNILADCKEQVDPLIANMSKGWGDPNPPLNCCFAEKPEEHHCTEEEAKTCTNKFFGASFLLDKIPDYMALAGSDAYKYRVCWQRVHEDLLAHGVATESCAQYFFGGADSGGPAGMRMKFVPCDERFIKGFN